MLYKKPKAKDNELKVQYGQEYGNHPELFYCWGTNIPKSHTYMVMSYFNNVKDNNNKTFLQELEDLGYDISTLKFTIQKKKQN